MKKRSPVNTEHPFISGQKANLLSEIGDIIPAALLRRWGMVFGISHRDTGIWAIALWNLKLFHNFRIAQAGQSGINIAGSNAVGMRGQHQVCGGAGDIFPVTVAVFRGGNYNDSRCVVKGNMARGIRASMLLAGIQDLPDQFLALNNCKVTLLHPQR